MSWKFFKSGNTMNTEDLNRILNPEYLTGTNSVRNPMFVLLKVFVILLDFAESCISTCWRQFVR